MQEFFLGTFINNVLTNDFGWNLRLIVVHIFSTIPFYVKRERSIA